MRLILISLFRRSERDILATKFLFSLEKATMKNSRLVISKYRVVKVCYDDHSKVTWQKNWYYYDWEIETALKTNSKY